LFRGVVTNFSAVCLVLLTTRFGQLRPFGLEAQVAAPSLERPMLNNSRCDLLDMG